MKKLTSLALFLVTLALALPAAADWDQDEADEYHKESQEALTKFKNDDPDVQKLLDSAPGYVILPSVGKGGFIVGGARGHGILYEMHEPVAIVTMTQVSVGLQAGGQAFSEFIIFEDQAALDNFKHGNTELSAQMSAVAVRKGASSDAKFSGGMAIFTQPKGGAMLEASVGGQKFELNFKD